MNDRVSLNPGRVLVTPENGGEAFYATLTRADNPTQEGDPLNKSTLLKDATAALYGKDENALPDEIFAEIFAGLSRKISMDLLWENASPTSSFDAQTISVDLSAYDFCAILTEQLFVFQKNISDALRRSSGIGGYGSYKTILDDFRFVTINNDSVVFQGGQYEYPANDGSHTFVGNDNSKEIPIKIFGIKGVYV